MIILEVVFIVKYKRDLYLLAFFSEILSKVRIITFIFKVLRIIFFFVLNVIHKIVESLIMTL